MPKEQGTDKKTSAKSKQNVSQTTIPEHGQQVEETGEENHADVESTHSREFIYLLL